MAKIPKEKSYMQISPQEYISTRLNAQIQWFDEKSIYNQKRYKRFKKSEYFLTFFLPVVGIIPLGDYSINKLFLILIGAIIAYLQFWSRIETYYELWYKYRTTYELLQKEKYFFEIQSSNYSNCQDCFSLLVERTESIISHTDNQWNRVIQMVPQNIDKNNFK